MASVNLDLRKNRIDNSEDHEIDGLFDNEMLLPMFRQAFQWVMQLLWPLFVQANPSYFLFVDIDALETAAVYFLAAEQFVSWAATEQAMGWLSSCGPLA